MDQSFLFPVGVVFTASVIAAVTDVWKFKIHNILALPLLLTGLLYHGVVGGMAGAGLWTGLLNSFLGALFGFGVLIVFYALGGMGGGDVKLMAAAGAWLGLPLTVLLFLASALAAGVYAIVLIVATGRMRETWVNLQIIGHRVASFGKHLGAEDHVEVQVNRADRRARVIPFAAMIAVGLVVALVVLSFVGAMH